MSIQPNGSAPYAAPQSVLDLIHAYRNRGLSTPFTADVLVRAGVAETLVPRTLQALRLLDLIDEEGNPTQAFEVLRRAGQAEYPQRLEAIIRSAYAEVFRFVDPAQDDESKVRDAFRVFEPIGQLPRMVRLFLSLCAEANLISEVKRQSTPKTASRPNREARKKAATSRGTRVPAPSHAPSHSAPIHNGTFPPAIAGILAGLPPNGQGWTKAQRDKFVAAFGSVLDFSIPIHEEPSNEPDGVSELDVR